VLEAGLAAGVFPSATVEIGSGSGPLWQDALGQLSVDPDVSSNIDTPYDLASLTKVLATTPAIMQLIAVRALALEDRVASFFRDWRGADRASVTIRDLLEHASGLPARLVDAAPPSRREFEHEICDMPLEYAPRTRSIYSDLGFILLGFIAEQRGGATLRDQFASIAGRWLPASNDRLVFELRTDARRRAAPTCPLEEDRRRGRALVGEVHDPYAAALGGVAGHAGLFGSVPAVGAVARLWLRAARGEDGLPSPLIRPLVQQFIARSTVPGSSRALGWDTMLPSSSCGSHMSASAFGHVGFTGTSLWIDPERDRYFVLLTNRASRGGTIEDMRVVRRAFHDALCDV